jgi:anaerobic dimethyl sulfoxide reductase subunit B (iron-sulfur subunit)
MNKQYAFYFDSAKCSGCKTCQIACKDKNDLGLGILWRRIYEVSKGEWKDKNGAWSQNIITYNLSLACNHCEDPICADVCPTKAMIKNRNGIVTVDEDKCIGCRYCEWACPYGAPQYDNIEGTMTKCNLCYDYVEEGRNPSCVDACPMRVLDFGELRDIKEKYGAGTELYPLPRSTATKPAIVITNDRISIDINDPSAEILNGEEI